MKHRMQYEHLLLTIIALIISNRGAADNYAATTSPTITWGVPAGPRAQRSGGYRVSRRVLSTALPHGLIKAKMARA